MRITNEIYVFPYEHISQYLSDKTSGMFVQVERKNKWTLIDTVRIKQA